VPGAEIAVVVPTHRRLRSLRRLLQGLAEQTLPTASWEVVVVDDGSGEAEAATIDEMARSSPMRARAVHLHPALGPARARNTGWRSTDAPLLAFIDDDCVPHPSWLQAGLDAFARPEVGVVQGRTVLPDESDSYPYTPFTVVREVPAPSPWFEGCNVFYRRDALEQTGGFDESFGTFPGGEDTNLGWSVVGAGWERAWADQAVVEHEIGERPWTWHLRFHWLEGNTVHLAARHPEIRRSFWRPWAVKRENALFAAAVAGALAGVRFRPAVLATAPYLLWLAPGRKVGPAGAALQVSAHAASLCGKLLAGLEERTFLL
jgi:GT2 family glycosyltransferase